MPSFPSSDILRGQWNIEQVCKRDGRMVPFDRSKIVNAIFRAARAVGGNDKAEAERLSNIVCKKIMESGKRFPTVEEIQDIVEKILIEEGHAKTAKAFILYRAKRAELRAAAAEAARNHDQEKSELLDMFAHKSKLASLIGYDRLEAYKNILFYLKDLQKSGKLPTHSGDYLGGNEIAKSFYERKYYLKSLAGRLIEKRPEDVFARLAAFAAAVESDEKKQRVFAEDFYNSLYEGHFLPGGRVIAGAGDLYRLKTLANCFVSIMDADNLESIYKTAYECARTYSYGGGIGIDISTLRPAGSVVHNAADSSTGAVSFMELYSMTTGLIGQSGRRGALMITLDIKHPDSPLFIRIKKTSNWVTNQIVEQARMTKLFNEEDLLEIERHVRENTQVRSANISLKMSDEFMRAVEEQNEYGPDTILVYDKDRAISSRDVAQGGEINYSYGIPSKPVEAYTLAQTFKNISELNAFLAERGAGPLSPQTLASSENRDMFGDYLITIPGSTSDLAIKHSGDFMLYFNSSETGEVKRMVKARDIWDAFIEGNHQTAEPGLIFWTNMVRFSPSNYVGRLIASTNPCGEVPLEDGGACNLGSINLSRFVLNSYSENATIDWDGIAKTAYILTRFLDNIVTWNETLNPLEKQRKTARETRRLGIGVMGIADMLNQLNLGYDSSEGIAEMERVMRFIANQTYRSSADLAEEKSPSPIFDYEAYSRGEFFRKNLEEKTKEIIHQKGLRNISLLSIAPTGTISNIVLSYKVGDKNYLGVSGGIEPVFALYYQRRSESLQNRVFKVFHATVEAYINERGLGEKAKNLEDVEKLRGILPEHFFRTAHSIAPDKRIAIQAICQQYVDHSISSTVNLPEDTEPEVISNIYLDAWKKGLKGITIYRDGSRFPILSVESAVLPFNEYKNKEFSWRGEKISGVAVITLASGRLTTPYHALKLNLAQEENGKLLEVDNSSRNKEEMESIASYKDSLMPIGFAVFGETNEQIEARKVAKEVPAGATAYFATGDSGENIIATPVSATMHQCPSCHRHTLKMENGCNACTNVECGYGSCE